MSSRLIFEDCASTWENSVIDRNQHQRYSALSYGLGYSRRSEYKFSRGEYIYTVYTYIYGRICTYLVRKLPTYLQLSRMPACRKARCRAGQIHGYRRDIASWALHTPGENSLMIVAVKLVRKLSLAFDCPWIYLSPRLSIEICVPGKVQSD